MVISLSFELSSLVSSEYIRINNLKVLEKTLKGIGGVKGHFFIIILFNLVLTKLQDAFYRF